MPKVTIKNKQVFVGKKNIPLISGEVHYWRLNPGYWKNVLKRVQELGIRVISTYVPWHYHAYADGQFDFTGRTNPSRNLKGFLELTRKLGLYVILRPGPYIYSEWPNDGVTDEAFKYHKLDPRFLKLAKRYLEEVAKIAKPFLASRTGGNILLVQADNEIDPWPDRFGHQYGLGAHPGLFQKFLERLYQHNLDGLNSQWGTKYKNFGEAGAFIASVLPEERGLALKGDQELKRNVDYFKFKYDYSRKYAEWVIRTFRELGYDIPIYLNLYPFFYAHDWLDLQQAGDFVGVDLYPTNEFHEDAFEQRKLMDKIRYLKNVSRLPFIAEFESGIWHERQAETGIFSANHYRLLALTALMSGAVGWNWYMLVNRDNWYQSPINEWGRTRPDLYQTFKDIVDLFLKLKPAAWIKITEISLTLDPLQHATKSLIHGNKLLTALYKNDIDYEICDLRQSKIEKSFLIYSGNQWLDTQCHHHLRRYVESGGTLIAFQDFPRKDENFKPLSIIGFEEPERILFEFKKPVRIRFGRELCPVEVVTTPYVFKSPPGTVISGFVENYGNIPVGYVKKIGKGKIVHLGVEPHGNLLLSLFEWLEISLVCRSLTPDVKTALFQQGKTYFLIAVNNGDENKSALIEMPALRARKNKMQAVDILRNQSVAIHRNGSLTLPLPRKDGCILRIQPVRS